MKITPILLTLLLLVGLTACKGNKNEYDASGVFEATEIIVSSEGNGKILTFGITEGDLLSSEQLVGYIDTTQLYLQKVQTQAASGAIKNRKANVPLQISSLEEQIATQKREQTRFTNLVKANAANQKQLDDINSNISVLERQLAAQRDNLVNSNESLSEEYTGQELRIKQLEDQITKSLIKSPISGTVLAKYAEPGELATTGKPLFKIADLENIFLRAYITSGQLTQLKIGQEVTVYADYGDKERAAYPGKVTWIADKAEFTPKTIQTRDERANLVYAVKIAVKNDGIIKKGMYGEVKF